MHNDQTPHDDGPTRSGTSPHTERSTHVETVSDPEPATPPKAFFRHGTAHIVSSSHNDIAWWNTPYKTMEYRDTHIITPAIEMIQADPEFSHTMECVLYLMEYLSRHPERYDLLHRLALEGRLLWGATYTQPFENALPDEALARQLYLGKKWMMTVFPGTNPRTAWSPDVPGRAMQFAQVLAKSGVEYLMISRVDAGPFVWYSPDGSCVTGFSPGHYYHSDVGLNRSSPEEIRAAVEETLSTARQSYERRDIPPEFLYLSVADYAPPHNYRELIDEWPAEDEREGDLPALKHSTAEEFMEALTANPGARFRTFRGERPNEWAYILSPTHLECFRAARRAATILPQAELFATTAALVAGSFDAYPSDELMEGWRRVLYMDHGLGGGNGHITDAVFLAANRRAEEIATRLRDAALQELSDRVDVRRGAGPNVEDAAGGRRKHPVSKRSVPVVVFNPLSRKRTDTVRHRLDVSALAGGRFTVTDAEGTTVPFQVVDEPDAFTLELEFLATHVPSMGYATYFVTSADDGALPSTGRQHPPEPLPWLPETAAQRRFLQEERADQSTHPSDSDTDTDTDPDQEAPLTASTFTCESPYYTVTLGQGGIISLVDKETDRELLDTSHFRGFEIVALQSEGTGAGEFETIQTPTLDYVDTLKHHPFVWERIADGEIKTTFRGETPFSFCRLNIEISVYHVAKRIDCDVAVESFDGTPNKELRLAMPLRGSNTSVAYDVPFGVVEVGTDEVAGAACTETFPHIDTIRYPHDCRDGRIREVQNWIGATRDNHTVFLSSDVSVWDLADPWAPNEWREHGNVCLQAILLASRRSCHGWGNRYLQRGTHRFSVSLSSHPGGWRAHEGCIDGRNAPLLAVVPTTFQRCGMRFRRDTVDRISNRDSDPATRSDESHPLPPSLSFFHVDEPNVVVSAVKKAEDHDRLVLRAYENHGSPTEAHVSTFVRLDDVRSVSLIEEPSTDAAHHPTPHRNGSGFVVNLGARSIETVELEVPTTVTRGQTGTE